MATIPDETIDRLFRHMMDETNAARDLIALMNVATSDLRKEIKEVRDRLNRMDETEKMRYTNLGRSDISP